MGFSVGGVGQYPVEWKCPGSMVIFLSSPVQVKDQSRIHRIEATSKWGPFSFERRESERVFPSNPGLGTNPDRRGNPIGSNGFEEEAGTLTKCDRITGENQNHRE